MADELETVIQELGPQTVAAFIAETVVGSSLGCATAVPGYFKRIRQICDRYGVLLVLDEVMCGMGRTGTLFACEQEQVVPDMVTFAKGLAGGYMPLGALFIADRIHRTIEKGSNVVMHGHTFMGHATACAAGLAAQKEIDDKGLLANVQVRGVELRKSLEARFGDHPHVGDIRGRGLFLALELVANRDSKEPFDPELKVNAKIKERGMEHGLICYPMGGIVDGRKGDHVMIAPPFIINSQHVEEIVDKLERTVDSVLTKAAIAA